MFSRTVIGADECAPLRRRQGAFARVLRLCLSVMIFGLGVGLLALSLLCARLLFGPLEIGGLGDRIGEELSARMGGGYEFKVGRTELTNDKAAPVLSVTELTLQSQSGRTILVAPHARLTVEPWGLLLGRVRPRSLELSDIDIRLLIEPSGEVAIAAGTEPIVLSRAFNPPAGEPQAPQEPAPADAQHVPTSAIERLAAAIGLVLDMGNGAESPLGVLGNFSISNGRLLFEDHTADRSTVFEGVGLSLDRSASGASLAFSADGPAGRWSANLRTSGEQGSARFLEVDVRELSFEEIALIAGLRERPAEIETPISVQARFGLDAKDGFSSAEGSFQSGKGLVILHDPDAEPVSIDETKGAFRWDPARHMFSLQRTEIRSGDTLFAFSGHAQPPSTGNDVWVIEMNTEPGTVFGPDRKGQVPVIIDRGSLSARLIPAERRLTIDRLEMSGPEVSAAATIDLFLEDAGPHVRTAMTVSRMPVRALLRLWPSPAASPVRGFLLDNLKDGFVEGTLASDYDAEMLAAMRNQRPPPDNSTRADFKVSGGTLTVIPGLPPLSGVEAAGHVTGRTSTVNVGKAQIELGNGHRLNLSEGVFVTPNNELRPPPANVNLRVTGSLEAVSDLLAREALKKFGGLIIDVSQMKGQVDGRLSIDLKLDKVTRPEDTIVAVNATVSQLTIDHLVGKEKFDQGQLAVTVDRTGLKANGQGKLFGAPATIDLSKSPTGTPDAAITFTMDDAARAKMGFNLGSALTGTIGLRVTSAFTGQENQPAHVEADFTKAAIDNLAPGFVKPVGRPAKATFVLNPSPQHVLVDQFTFDAPGGALAKGTMELDPTGNLKAMHFSQLRLSAGDDMKVDGDFTKELMKLTVRGTSIDARPFIRQILGTDLAAKEQASKDFELDLRSPLVTGNNRQALSAVELRVARRGGVIRNLQLQARSGRATLSGGILRSQDGDPVVSLNAQDAGGLLSFLDLYKRMEGGRLQLAGRIDDRGIDGSFVVNEFVLRDEPALRRLVTEGVAVRDERNALKIDTNAASFTRMAAGFMRGGGQMVIREGVIYGPQIGIKLDGAIDFNRDTANLSGTFVPAYGLNNLFSQIPVFGPILGGGNNEGLFAVNFRITGQATAPVLTINPLSAIAPGVLRKMFGVGDFMTPQGQQPRTDGPMQLGPPR